MAYCPSQTMLRAVKAIRSALGLLPAIIAIDNPTRADSSPFERENLVAWCIVPFDEAQRSPEERAAMLKELGIRRLAYDWRQQHVDEFEREILACRKEGIEFFAFWNEHPDAFRLFKKYGLTPQIWKTAPSPQDAASQSERVAAAGKILLPLVERARELGSQLGLYNHGGWGGEPENLVAVTEWLRREANAEHVGIVYNLHHGHGHFERLGAALEMMEPYLLCLNLNGMNPIADPKIVSIGDGPLDSQWYRLVLESGYTGPIGILDHRHEMDARQSLSENLAGLESLRSGSD